MSSAWRWAWLFPPLLLAAFLWRHGVDLPWFDQWELVPQLEKWSAGTLTVADLLTPQNEHRLFFPRALMVGMAALSHWNVRWELAATFLFAVGTFVVVALRLKRMGSPWLWPLASLLIFSFTQKENWLWGWQLQITMSVLTGVWALERLSRVDASTASVAAASALAVVSGYSFANGFALFPVGALVLWWVGRAQPVRLALLGVVGAAAVALYVHGFHQIEGHPSLAYSLHHPFVALYYLLAYLGSPLGFGNSEASATVALAGTVALVWLLRERHRAGAREEVAFALGLAGWAAASAALTAIGRAGFGAQQAVSSRYVTIATLYWLALLVLAAGHARARRPLVAVVALLALACYPLALRDANSESWERLVIRDLVRTDPAKGALRIFPPEAQAETLRRLEFLRQHHLSLYR
jgi:hypothetical protein